ncbi:MAG TPA: bifunctional DNA-formamidopyrimidine glycosylase/DNA-(apurinic or apyrimidinic site) lyase [Bacillota bacterium]|nr:bifunctional DNA-formamidopyrimidine glycosylase/DNA-(apurinic or apyrimidinic site) lyase [Bacillota bacterium]
MPELPEVETVRLSLVEKLTGRKITAVTVHYPRMVELHSVEEFKRSVTGKTIQRLERRGKYLLLRLSEDLVLALHLRMTGQLTVQPMKQPVADATYFILRLDNDTELRFRDQRKFGKVFTFSANTLPTALAKMGPEPLADEFTLDMLRKRFTGRKLAVKKALLNQEIIAGIGNIYADEALFVAGIHPVRLVDSLTEPELEQLHQAIRQVLQEGIANRGTTKRDYLDGEGNPGTYQNMLRVYGRKGLPCPQCGAPVAKMNFGGRGTHFCPLCQK